MKGIKKCFLYSFILMLASLVSSSVIYSPNTYALRHEYQTIPAYSGAYIGEGGNTFGNPSFDITWSNDYAPTNAVVKYQHILGAKLNSAHTQCIYRWDGVSPIEQSNYYNLQLSIVKASAIDISNDNDICETYLPFSASLSNNPNFPDMSLPTIPSFDSGSISILNSNSAVLSQQLPYRWQYDHFYLKDSAINDENGVTYYKSFAFSDLYSSGLNDYNKYIPNKFKQLTLPFDAFNQEIGGALTQDRSVEFRGVFNFPGVTPESGFSWSENFLQSGYFRLYWLYGNFETGNYNANGYVDCELTRIFTSGSMQIQYSCPLTMPSDMSGGYFIPYIRISSSDYIFDTTADWTWSGVYVVTDNDETPGAVISEDCTGSNCENAPGSASSFAEGDEDFFSSLVNLFGFSFINPFSPLFTMFTSGSTCANIPILAGMLNSSETTYCSWFNSSTRDILTPVLSISAMMLVFGFAVRWLSSSSGNMFEDQTTHKSSNTQATGKG